MKNNKEVAAAFSLGDVRPMHSFQQDGGGAFVELNAPGHPGAGFIVWRMEGDERSPKQEELAKFIANACETHDLMISALKDQHKAVDWLMAQLIVVDPKFKPSRSKIWPLLNNVSEAFKKIGAL